VRDSVSGLKCLALLPLGALLFWRDQKRFAAGVTQPQTTVLSNTAGD
jgi:hypothetical protein